MKLYRYEMWEYEDHIELTLVNVNVIKETPCGYRFVPAWYFHGDKMIVSDAAEKHSKWTSKDGVSRKWHANKDDALKSYKYRCNKRLEHANRSVVSAKYALQLTEEGQRISKKKIDCFVLI